MNEWIRSEAKSGRVASDTDDGEETEDQTADAKPGAAATPIPVKDDDTMNKIIRQAGNR